MNGPCQDAATHIDNKGFLYCAKHGLQRRSSGTPARQLSAEELARLSRGESIEYARRKAAPKRQADPDRILANLKCRRVSPGTYRVVHGATDTAYVIIRNENEPDGHPLAWSLSYSPKDSPDEERWMDANSHHRGHRNDPCERRTMLRQVAEHMANVKPIDFL